MKSIVFLLALVACTQKKAPAPEPSTPTVEAVYLETKARLLTGFLDKDNYVISHQPDGSSAHEGDSLIWQGMALYALRCSDGNPIAQSVHDMMEHLDGGMWRHPSLPDQISLDGALGVYLGIARRVVQCGERPIWEDPFTKHKALGKLNPKSDEPLPAGFDYVRDLLLTDLGLASSPSPDAKAVLESAVVLWATGVAVNHEACYRVHLGLITFQTVEMLGGKISNEARAGFCEATNGLGLPTVDRWCGRTGLVAYLDGFKYNQWEFRHQRCPAWETPDGQGLSTPALDRLVAIRDQYDIGP